MSDNISGIIVIERIKVENANAIAGMTWGFPAISNFLGFTHALQRKFAATSDNPPLKLLGVGIVCHQSQVQAYKPNDMGDYSFALTRNPVDKKGDSPPFIEEGRMHMEVSLVIPFEGFVIGGDDAVEEVCDELLNLALTMRLAGGTILTIENVDMMMFSESDEKHRQMVKSTMRKLLPGFALVSRQSTLAKHQEHCKNDESYLTNYGATDAELAAWLEFSSISYSPSESDQSSDRASEQVKWDIDTNPYSGWLKPITVGYRAISNLYPAGQVINARDNQTPVRMVEWLYSLGEWLSPHRIKDIEQLYWYAKFDEQNGLYQCVNDYQVADEDAAIEIESL